MDFVRFVAPGAWGFPVDLTTLINDVAKAARVVPCALGAIVRRESGGRNVIQDGTDLSTMYLPDGSRPGVGLCQITWAVDWSDFAKPRFYGIWNRTATYDLWNKTENLECACYEFVLPARISSFNLRGLYKGYGKPWESNILYLEFAVYNAGEGAVAQALIEGRDPDTATTDNYASGVNALYQQALATSHAAH